MTGMAAGVACGGIVVGGGGGKLYDVGGYDISFWLLAPSTAGGGESDTDCSCGDNASHQSRWHR